MTKGNYYTFLGFILIGIIFRLVFETFQIDWTHTWAYLSFLTILSTYYGIYSQRQNTKEEFDFTMDFKGGAQGGSMFALGYGFFTYIFYKWIHPHFLEMFLSNRRHDIMQALTDTGQTDETIRAALDNFNSFAELIYVPGNLSVITITSLVFLSIVYGVIFAVIAKFFPKFVNQ